MFTKLFGIGSRYGAITRMLIGLLLGTAINLQAQDFSNKGRDFWIGYGNHVRMFNSGQAEQMQLYITSDAGTTGKVDIPGIGFSQPFTIAANQITTINIPRTAGLFDEGQYNLGIHVTAQKPVVVYSFIYVNAISGATVCLPTSTLGKEYYSVNFTQTSNESNSYSYFFVVAADTGTTKVEITPSQDSKGGWKANTLNTVSLTQGQVYQVLSVNDLTGSRIRSVSSATGGCKKIAVFCGSGKISIGCSRPGTSDNLYQQMYPVSTWGKRYITVPSVNNVNVGGQANYYRIFLSDPAASVSLNGTTIPATAFINRQYYEFEGGQTNYIESDKPVLVAQYFTTQGCSGNGGQGDPEMIYLNPLEQTIDKVTLNSMQPLTGTNINQHYINAVVPNTRGATGSFRVDGAVPATAFTPVAQNPAFAFIQLPVSQGTHNIICDSGFNAIAYGFGNAESYGYSAGTNLKDLYQFVSVRNVYSTVNFPAACKNSPFRFFMTFPYQPLQVKWQFNGLFPDTTIDNPVPDSSWVVNGRTLYRYPIGKYYSVPAIGTYPITVVANNPGIDGCGGQQEVNYDLQIFDPPKAAFSWTNNGCITDPVLFRDSTDGNGRAVVKWYWSFGEGSASAAVKNPAYQYATGGKFTVKLATITDVGCLSDTVSRVLQIADPPKTDFSLQGLACDKSVIRFTDNSRATTGTTMVKWYWNFGDSTQLVNPDNRNVQHNFPSAGTYNVSLQVETSTGCRSAVKVNPLTVHPLPVVDFLQPDVCLADPIAQFYDNTRIADNSMAQSTWRWDFGDGGNATQQNGQHRYAAVGTYTVKLSVTSKDGCGSDTSKLFTVNGSVPLAGFSVSNTGSLCSNQPVSIKDASTVDFGKIIRVEIYWDYRNDPTVKTVDSVPAAGRSYTHQYPLFGSPASKLFEIRYVVYSGITCLNQFSRIITVNGSPAIRFDSMQPVCEELAPFTVTAAHEIYGYTGTGEYSGDGINAAGLFNPKLAGPGTHLFTYRFTAGNGCATAQSAPVRVNPSPTVDAGPDRFLLEGGSLQLQPRYSGRGLTYRWAPPDFLDNSVSPTPTVTTPNDITYTITVQSADGCSASDDVFIKVLKKPVVPNVFTPNGDGINDTWVISYLDTYPGCTVDVYNRYGQLVYRTVGYPRPWDGRMNGQPLPVGVYYWIINPKNGRAQMNGTVTIIR